jgi:hypothetical protein
MSMCQAVLRSSGYFFAAAVLVLVFGTSDAAAQTSDCKACGVTCTPDYCTSSCIRMPINDCRTYNMQCAGLCYTFYDYSYGAFQCRTDPYWYPCYA